MAAEPGGTSGKTQLRPRPPGIPEGASADWGGPGSRTEQVREETGTQQPTGGGKPNVREQTSGWTRSGPTLDCHSALTRRDTLMPATTWLWTRGT